jgi:hypothetical protein
MTDLSRPTHRPRTHSCNGSFKMKIQVSSLTSLHLTLTEKKSYLMKMIQAASSPVSAPPPITHTDNHPARSIAIDEKLSPPSLSIPTAQSLIQDVKAIFPDYGEFFISSVLEVCVLVSLNSLLASDLWAESRESNRRITLRFFLSHLSFLS